MLLWKNPGTPKDVTIVMEYLNTEVGQGKVNSYVWNHELGTLDLIVWEVTSSFQILYLNVWHGDFRPVHNLKLPETTSWGSNKNPMIAI